MQRSQRLFRKATADLAPILQPAIVVVITKEQGAQALAAALRLGVAANDKLLSFSALKLDPITTAARNIGRVQAFAYDAFKAKFTGRAQHVRCLGSEYAA